MTYEQAREAVIAMEQARYTASEYALLELRAQAYDPKWLYFFAVPEVLQTSRLDNSADFRQTLNIPEDLLSAWGRTKP